MCDLTERTKEINLVKFNSDGYCGLSENLEPYKRFLHANYLAVCKVEIVSLGVTKINRIPHD